MEKPPPRNNRARGIGSVILLALVLSLPSTTPATAGPFTDFQAAAGVALDHYRQGLFYLRTGNAGVAVLELEAMAEKWRTLRTRFAADPPDIYAGDPGWRTTLEEVAERVADGAAAADAGDVEAAQAHLAPIRTLLSALRRRNHVFVFSDCVDEANAAFRGLFSFRHQPPDFASEEEVNSLRQATAVTIHWYARCKATAPAAIATDTQFQRLMEDSLYSLNRIWVAISEKNARNLVNILRLMSSWDHILYLKFG